MKQITSESTHAMIDIETLGERPGSIMLEVAIVYFDLQGNTSIGVSIPIDPVSSAKAGLNMTVSTVMWWMKQDAEAINSVANPTSTPLDIKFALGQINYFLRNIDYVWSHNTFDPVIIMENFKVLDIPMEFKHTKFMDLRTIAALSGEDTCANPNNELRHSALGDCKRQIQWAYKAINKCLDWRRER